jgi:hypothetical protein
MVYHVWWRKASDESKLATIVEITRLLMLIHARKQIDNGQILDPILAQSVGPDPFATAAAAARALGMANGIINPSDVNNLNDRRWSGSDVSTDGPTNGHMPHSICEISQHPKLHSRLIIYRSQCTDQKW